MTPGRELVRVKVFFASLLLGLQHYLACRMDKQSRGEAWRQARARMRLHRGEMVTL